MIDFSTATAQQVIADAEEFAADKKYRNVAHRIDQKDYLIGVLQAQVRALVCERDRLQRLLYPTPGVEIDDGDAEYETQPVGGFSE
jgi:hypothetical protein